jgi:hypothetical protein
LLTRSQLLLLSLSGVLLSKFSRDLKRFSRQNVNSLMETRAPSRRKR